MRPSIISIAVISVIFIGSAASFVLDCRFVMDSYSWMPGSFYTCRRDNISASFRRDDRYIEDVTGAHMAGKSVDDVVGVHIRGDRIYYFPTKFEKYFKHVTVMAIEYANMLEIRERDLRPFRDLEYLFLSYNMIEVIEKDLLMNNPKLKGIAMEHNRIRFIHADVFEHLTGTLDFFALEKAGCVDFRQISNIESAILKIKNACSRYDNFIPLLTEIYYAQRHVIIV